MPKSLTHLKGVITPELYLGLTACLSSIRAVLIASNGVTATTDSNNPAPRPAKTPLGPESFPSLSARSFLIESKPKNLTLALIVLPTTKAGHPVYNEETP